MRAGPTPSPKHAQSSTTLGRRAASLVLVASVVLAAGCASTRPSGGGYDDSSARIDPIEPFNRVIYTVNDKVDRAVFKPLAQGYEYVLPMQVRSCVSNVFGNISDVPVSLNNFLQGKIKEGGSDLCRVGVNTTVGVLGCFDIASGWGFEKHNEDFGQTLGRWGVPTGPYLVLPVFGPSTVRDSGGLVVDSLISPLGYANDVPVRNTAYGVRLIDKRAQALDTTNFIDNAALDPYVFVRDAYLSRRRSQILDGKASSGDTGWDASPPTSGEAAVK